MQIQNSSKMYRSMFDCAKYVYRSEGLGAFYISYPTTLSMTVPFTALQFLAYESISTAMNPAKNYDPMTHCLAGAVAGGFAAGLTTPMDVIKTMLQTRGTSTDPQVRQVNSFVGGCRLLYQRAGVAGFFKGVRPRIVTTMPSTAICWSAYEFSKYVDSSNISLKANQTSLLGLTLSSETTLPEIVNRQSDQFLTKCRNQSHHRSTTAQFMKRIDLRVRNNDDKNLENLGTRMAYP